MFKTEKAALSEALSAIKNVVKAKAKIPIHSNVLIERVGDHLLARGCNITLEISVPFAATIADSFEPFTVDAHRFAEIVSGAPDGAIAVDAISQGPAIANIQIKSGRSRLRLPVLPASDFPKLDAGTLAHSITLNSETLRKHLEAVKYAVATDVDRYYLCGVYFEPHADGLILVATDGLRLVRRIIGLDEIDEDDIGDVKPVIVPSETVDRMVKLLPASGYVRLDMSRDMIRIEASGRVLVSKLVDGGFPQYRMIMPPADAATSRFSGASIAGALGRLLAVAPAEGNGVLFSFRRDAIGMAARDLTTGEGEDEITAETDQELSVGFHGRHFREAIEHTDGDSVELRVANGGEKAMPALMRAAGDDQNYTILMPVKVKGMLHV